MYTPKTFDGSSNTVCFDPKTFRKENRAWGTYKFPREANLSFYVVKAFWVSTAQSTRGAIVEGQVTFIAAGEAYADLNFGDFLAFARNEKTPNRQNVRVVEYNAHVLLGKHAVWAGNTNNVHDRLAQLIELHKNLPAAPEGYTEWLTLKNKD